MATRVTLDNLAEHIGKELTLYHQDTIDKVKRVTRDSMKDLVKRTKSQRFKRDTGAYRGSIASKPLRETSKLLIMQWYVKDPDYRLTHLLESGHKTKTGTRTTAYGFLGKATDEVVQEYVEKVQEVIEND